MADKGLFIENLPRDGVVTFLALVKEKERRPKRNGGAYLYIVLGDRTGEVDAKVWDNPQEVAALFDRDDIVKVRGAVEHYNDKPQLIIQRVRRCEPGEFVEADFCPASARDPEEMWSALKRYVELISDDALRVLLTSILDDPDVAGRLRIAPAGLRIHHPVRGGLLEHIISLCELGALFGERYPRLNGDWLIAGAILHDLGKIEEFGTSRRLGYTTRGQLVGHVALGLETLERHVSRFGDFPLELKTVLQHLIVSHHGEWENGALRLPMFPEAIVLHYLDEIDARLEQAWRLIDQAPTTDEFTGHVPNLGRWLFRGFRPGGNGQPGGANGDPMRSHG